MKRFGSMALAACSAAAIGIVGCGTDGVSKTEEILSDGSNLLVKRQVVPRKTLPWLRGATDQLPEQEADAPAGGGMPFDVESLTGGEGAGAGAGAVGGLDSVEIGGAGDAAGTEFGGAGDAAGTEFGGVGDLSGLEFGGPAAGPLATTGRRGAFGGSADLASAFCNFFSAFCDFSVGCIDELASGTEEAEFGKAMLQGVCAPFQGPQCADLIQAGLDEAGAAIDQIPPETADILDCLADEISSASCTEPDAAFTGDVCGIGALGK